jgi:AraC family transcriptional regulator
MVDEVCPAWGHTVYAMHDEPNGSLMHDATGATIVLTVACRRTSDGAVEPDGLSITLDPSDQSTNRKDPVMQLQIHESALRHCYSMNHQLGQYVDGKSDPHSVSILLDRLSRALDAMGIDLRKRGGINKGVLRIVSSVSEKKRGVRALPKWRMVRVLAYIGANVSKAITLADLSAAAGMSRMYFASQFRAATGDRPHDFVLRKRIEHAQRLLMNTSQALVEVALNAGFQTQAHFTTVFRKFVGDTPHRWRREQAFLRSASRHSAFTTLAIATNLMVGATPPGQERRRAMHLPQSSRQHAKYVARGVCNAIS